MLLDSGHGVTVAVRWSLLIVPRIQGVCHIAAKVGSSVGSVPTPGVDVETMMGVAVHGPPSHGFASRAAVSSSTPWILMNTKSGIPEQYDAETGTVTYTSDKADGPTAHV